MSTDDTNARNGAAEAAFDNHDCTGERSCILRDVLFPQHTIASHEILAIADVYGEDVGDGAIPLSLVTLVGRRHPNENRDGAEDESITLGFVDTTIIDFLIKVTAELEQMHPGTAGTVATGVAIAMADRYDEDMAIVLGGSADDEQP